ncbi:MAG: hypothetical protein ACRDZP_05295 [Acidimicrobiales bacterium]
MRLAERLRPGAIGPDGTPPDRFGAERQPAANGGRRDLSRPVPAAGLDGPRRQPKLALLGLALVISCAAVGAELARSASHKYPYLALARSVPEGAVITAADLVSVSLGSVSGLDAIPLSDSQSVLGRRADSALVQGSLLVTEELTSLSAPVAGEALVGTSLQSNQAPAGLQPGDSVLIVAAGATATGGATTAGLTSVQPSQSPTDVIGEGVVFEVAPDSSGTAGGGAEEVTLEIAPSLAARVAEASAGGNVTLAEIPLPARATPKK